MGYTTFSDTPIFFKKSTPETSKFCCDFQGSIAQGLPSLPSPGGLIIAAAENSERTVHRKTCGEVRKMSGESIGVTVADAKKTKHTLVFTKTGHFLILPKTAACLALETDNCNPFQHHFPEPQTETKPLDPRRMPLFHWPPSRCGPFLARCHQPQLKSDAIWV